METTWKPVPLQLTPEMHAAGEAAALQFEHVHGPGLHAIWAAVLAAAPAKPVSHELEIIVSDRNNTYRASPKVCHATEAAGLQGKTATCTGGREGAVHRLLEKSSRRLRIEDALITVTPPESGDPSYRVRYRVVIGERGK